MDASEYSEAIALENSGKFAEAKRRLLRLASQGHPLGLLELSRRYLLDPMEEPHRYTPGFDLEKSRELADEAVQTLEEHSDCGDAEAMHHLACVYLGHYGPWYHSPETAEQWLLKSFRAGCRAAANELHRLYLGRDENKSRYWFQKIERRSPGRPFAGRRGD